jgi:hypothetical protein
VLLAGLVACFALCAGQASGGVIFTDNFNSGASPLWGNEVGNWTASGGVYFAQAPNNFPNAFSSLPFALTNFSVDVDVNSVSDGGIWLRSTAAPGTNVGNTGILFVTAHGESYWHIVTDGSSYGALLNIASGPTSGSNVHIHIEVAGDTYSAFIDGSASPITTLTTNAFASGQVALYDNSGQTFDNVVVATPGAVPEPSSLASALIGGLGAVGYAARRRKHVA